MSRIEEIEQRMAAIEGELPSPARIETVGLGDGTMRVHFDVSYPMYQVLAHAPFDISYLLEQVREAAELRKMLHVINRLHTVGNCPEFGRCDICVVLARLDEVEP